MALVFPADPTPGQIYALPDGSNSWRYDGRHWVVIAQPDTGITQLFGDVTAGPGNGAQTATLAATAVIPGSYTNADITVDAKGRLTTAANGTAGGNQTITLSGAVSGSGTTAIVTTLATVPIASGGTAGTTAAAALSNLGGAPISSPSFVGTPTAPTNAAYPATGSNSNILATTAFVTGAVGAIVPGISQLTGDVLAGPGSGNQAATIANRVVTYAKIQDVAASTLLGNPTGGAAAPSEITLGANLSFAGNVLNAASGGSGSINGVTAGMGLAGGGTTGTVTLSTQVASVTKTGNYTVAAADMGTTLVLGGATLTLTLPVKAAGIWQPGMWLEIAVTASGSWSVTNSTGLAMTGLNSTLPTGASGRFVANADGATLNFIPGMQAPLSTQLGGAKLLAPVANNFVTGLNILGILSTAQPSFANISGTLGVAAGGTGSTTAPAALTALGAAPIASPSFTGNATFAGTVTAGGAGGGVASQTGSVIAKHLATQQLFGLNAVFDGAGTFRSMVAGFAATMNHDTGTGDFAISVTPATVGAGAALAPSNALIIKPDRTCLNNTGTWSTISDASVKSGMQPYLRGLEAILALEPVAYVYNDKAPFQDDDQRVRYGLIADHVKPHIPEAVGTYDYKPDPGKDEVITLSTLDPGSLTYVMINAIKELKAELDELKAALPTGGT